ncbi:MAG: phytoene desaturase family protein [Cytophagales bacterium]
MTKKVSVIGSGFSGLSASSYLAKKGYEVTLFEKHDQCGGRARVFENNGFVFDMGPSWYWMPDVFEKFYNDFGYTTSELYELKRLDPSYRIYFNETEFWDVPAELEKLYDLFESVEKGSAKNLKKFLEESKYKYEVGVKDLVYRPSRSIFEFFDIRLMTGVLKLDVFNSMSNYVRKLFKDPRIIQLLEFPVLFLGAKPQNIPALYSLMNYADIELGTWYPMGGMNKIVQSMERIAKEQGVSIIKSTSIKKVVVDGYKANGLLHDNGLHKCDIVVSSSDYHFTDTVLLPEGFRNYSDDYWQKRVMAPSCLIYYLGVSKKLQNLKHHNLFFDKDFDVHAKEIYENLSWPTNPLFYVSCPSVTDSTVAPDRKENLFILIPVAPGLKDNPDVLEKYFNLVMDRLEKITKQDIRPFIEYRRNFAHNDFVKDYNAFKGNAYGLANTLKQTAILKPSLKSKHLDNFYFTGQLTVPGPGVPPSIISGEVVANEIFKEHKL